MPIAENEYAIDGACEDQSQPPDGRDDEGLIDRQTAGDANGRGHCDFASAPAHIEERHAVHDLQKWDEAGNHREIRGEADGTQ